MSDDIAVREIPVIICRAGPAGVLQIGALHLGTQRAKVKPAVGENKGKDVG